MKVHVATIEDARRRKNKAFDSVLIVFTVPVSENETEKKTYKLEMINDPFLLNKLFDFTNTTSDDVKDVIGKSFRAVFGSRKSAIGHPTEDRFVIPNQSGEFKFEDLNNI